jgi:GNAT superfamily N-acetyltransferase
MLRVATANDISEIRLLMQSVPGFWQTHWSDRTIERAIDSANGLAFVWETNFHILGFVCAHDVGFRGYLSELVVARESRKQGIGRALLQKVEQTLGDRNHEILIADVWHDALPFYRTLGWEKPEALLLRHKLKRQGFEQP